MPKSCVVLLGFLLTSASFAQKPASTGSVTGHVTCADTNTPARLAIVVLRPVPAAKSMSTGQAGKPVEARRVQTLLGGSFTIPNVAPGTYLVMASLPGYIAPFSALGISNEDLLEPSDELKKRIVEHIPTVTVEGVGTSSINISLDRAAAVSGTILYDDGSPASGVGVQLQEQKDGKWVRVHNDAGDGMWSGNSTTDDRGDFRITGVPPLKEAIVQAELRIQNSTLHFGRGSLSTSSGLPFTLAFYSGGALRPKDAKPFQLTMGEDRPGEDITLPLSKLHKLEGVLVAKKDGHVLNQGSVSLLFADDHSHLGLAMIDKNDERFNFAFVPEGDYILKVDSAADASFEEIPNSPGSVPPTHTKMNILHEYGTTEIPVHVDSERSDLTINVPDKTPTGKSVAQQ